LIISGFSGNEWYCLAEKGYAPGSVVVGNSVQSLGFIGNLSSGLRTIAGGEIVNLTQLISEGRHAALARLEQEAQQQGAHGVTGVYSDLKDIAGMKEFIAIGSAVKGDSSKGPFFTTACSGQDFYCHLDAGYQPRHFAIGNVAYALGLGRGITGAISGMAGGEVREYSDMINRTRHLALERIEAEAKGYGANAVVDIKTQIIQLGGGAREMLLVGTGSYHPALGTPAIPVTSELTGEELWNLHHLGYQPLKLLLASSVYSLGIAQGIGAFFRSFSRGEVGSVTQLIYQARANCLGLIHQDATTIGADGVIGVKLFIHEFASGLVEVMAIGTAVKKNPAMRTETDVLIPQAIIRDRDTFFDAAMMQPKEKNLQRGGE
jgi:uncharacterized protein YbjQ (UPF0145 family)